VVIHWVVRLTPGFLLLLISGPDVEGLRGVRESARATRGRRAIGLEPCPELLNLPLILPLVSLLLLALLVAELLFLLVLLLELLLDVGRQVLHSGVSRGVWSFSPPCEGGTQGGVSSASVLCQVRHPRD